MNKPSIESIEREDSFVCSRLAERGLHLEGGIYDLVNNNFDYLEFVPDLMACFDYVTEDRIIEGLVRSLTIKSKNHDIASFLLEQARRYIERDDFSTEVVWVFGNALNFNAKPEHLDAIIDLTTKSEVGTGRKMLATCIGRIGKKEPEKAYAALLSMLEEEDLVGHAIGGLRALGEPKAIPYIEPYLNSPNQWIEKTATKAIAWLQKKLDKQKTK